MLQGIGGKTQLSSAVPYRDDSPTFQGRSMPFDQLRGDSDSLLRWNIRKSNEPGVWNAMQVNKRPEVRIDGDEDSIFGVRPLQQRPITGIRDDLSGLDDIVTAVVQPFRQPAAGAAVHQEFQRLFTDTATSVSPAITACA